MISAAQLISTTKITYRIYTSLVGAQEIAHWGVGLGQTPSEGIFTIEVKHWEV